MKKDIKYAGVFWVYNDRAGSVVEETGPDRGRDLFISHRTVLFCHPNDLACPHIDHVAKA